MKLLEQNAKKIKKSQDTFGFYNIVHSIKDILKKNNNPIIGLFGGYGEGKSSVIETLKAENQKKDTSTSTSTSTYCFIDIDLWKYERDEIRFDFNKVYHSNKSRYYNSDSMASFIFDYAKLLGGAGTNVANIYATKRGISHRNYEHYFKHNDVKQSIDEQRKEKCKAEGKAVLIIENLDRLTTEDKIFALSTLYNHRDFIDLPMIITLDPDSVQEDSIYFENLINKVFTAFIVMPNKTKTLLSTFIKKEFLSCGKINLSGTLTDILLTQYPITLRQIKHIINNFFILYDLKDDSAKQKISMLLAILQSNFPLLHSKISKNPFYIEIFRNKSIDIYKNIYNEFEITQEESYKLNRLFREIGSIDIMQPEILKTVSPLFDFDKEDIRNYNNSNYLPILEKNNKLKIVIELLNEAHYEEEIISILTTITQNSKKENKDRIIELFLEGIQNKETFKQFFLNANYQIFSPFFINNTFSKRNHRKFLNTILHYEYNEKEHNILMGNIFSFIQKFYFEKSVYSKECDSSIVKLSLENREFFDFFINEEYLRQKFIALFFNLGIYIQIDSLETDKKLYYFRRLIEVYKPEFNSEQDKELIESYISNMFETVFLDSLENSNKLFDNYKEIFLNYEYLTIRQAHYFMNSNFYITLELGKKLEFFQIIINLFYTGKKIKEDIDKLIFYELIENFLLVFSKSNKEFLYLKDNLEAIEQISVVDGFLIKEYDGLLKSLIIDILKKNPFLGQNIIEVIYKIKNKYLIKSIKFETSIKSLLEI